jgi:hypothetical protein
MAAAVIAVTRGRWPADCGSVHANGARAWHMLGQMKGRDREETLRLDAACRSHPGVAWRSLQTLRWRSARAIVLIAATIAIVLANAAAAFADRAMSTRFSVNDTGNITFAANTLMVCPATTPPQPAPGCTAARNTSAVASGSNPGLNNNGYLMQYVNTAPGTVGATPSFDSSSSDLVLPSTATVLFAGLYWGGDTNAGSSPNGVGAPTPALRNQVGFHVPGTSGYATIVASQVDSSAPSAPSRYNAFADVTARVQAAGAGTYSIANVQAGTGGDRYAGWTLVVAYEDSTQPPRNLTATTASSPSRRGRRRSRFPCRASRRRRPARFGRPSGSSPTRATRG